MSTGRLLSGLLLVAFVAFVAPTVANSTAPVPAEKSLVQADEPLPDGCLLRLGSARLRHDHCIQAIAFSQDGRYLVSAGDGDSIRLWSMPDERLVRSFPVPAPVYAMALSSEANLVAAGGAGWVRLWDLSTGQVKNFLTIENEKAVFSLAFSPDGKNLLGGGKGVIWKWEVLPERELWKLSTSGTVHSVAVSPDGATVLAGSSSGDVLLLNTEGKKVGRQPRIHFGGVHGLAFSSDGEKFATAGLDRTARVYHPKAESSDPVTLRALSSDVQTLAFANGGKTIITGGSDRILRAWDATTGKAIWTHQLHEGAIHCIAVSPDGKLVASGGTDCVIRLCDAESGKAIDPPTGHGHRVTRVCFSPDGRFVASGGEDASVRLWDARNGKELYVFPIPARSINTLAFSSDSSHLAAAGGYLRIWDVETGKASPLPAKLAEVLAFAYAPDGKQFAAADPARGVVLGSLETDTPERVFRAGGHRARSLAFAPDGKTLIVGYSSGPAVRCWETATGKELQTLPAQDSIALITVSANGLLATTGDDRLALWSLPDNRPIGSLQSGYVAGLAFSPGGGFLFRADEGTRLRCYEPLTGGQRFAFEAGERVFLDVAVSPEGTRFAAACSNGTILIGSLLFAKGKLAPTPPREADLEKWWADLAVREAASAHTAHCLLFATAEQSLPFLRARLQPAASIPPERLKKLLAELDHDEFARREAAALELRGLGERGAVALRQALKGEPSAEFRRRATEMLDQLARDNAPPETLRVLRAVELLEQLGTKDAHEILAALAGGDPLAEQTRAAKGALSRLKARQRQASAATGD